MRLDEGNIETTGYAPNDAMCHCEHCQCHPRGNCNREAVFEVVAYGIKQFLCPICLRRAKEILRNTNI